MPVQPTYPGVYIEDQPAVYAPLRASQPRLPDLSGKRCVPVRPTNWSRSRALPITNPSFGGLHRDMTLSYAVRDFFLNGGGQA